MDIADIADYPKETELETIRTWYATDFTGLMDYICHIWWMATWGFKIDRDTGIYHLSTGGWSGNEDIIRAMQDNFLWWSLHWVQSRRGGHYQFIDYKLATPAKTPDSKPEALHTQSPGHSENLSTKLPDSTL